MEHYTHPTELLPAYALDILDPAERAAVEAHLESCQECRAEVAKLLEVNDLLALAVPELVAPDGLRKRLLDEVHQVPPVGRKEGDGGRRQRVEQALGRFWAWPIWRPAAAALILLLIISNVFLFFRLQQIETQEPGGQQTINLAGTDAAPEAGGIMLIRQGQPTGTLVVNGLPDLGPEQQYQLWLVRDGVRDSGAVFSVAEEGFTSVDVTAPDDLTAYSRFGITIEPAGGSPGPTGDGVLRSSTPQSDGE